MEIDRLSLAAALKRVEQGLSSVKSEVRLSKHPDLTQEILSGTLRYHSRIQFILEFYAKSKKPKGLLLGLLKIATFQVLFQEKQRVERVVFESVEVIKKNVGLKPSQFANHYLRTLVKEKTVWEKKDLHKVADELWWCVPALIWKDIKKRHGIDFAIRFAEACLERPRSWAVYKEKGEVRPLSSVVNKDLELGLAFVQDLSSQAVIKSFCEKIAPGTLLDLCAAPGGKSFGLALRGWSVIATDQNLERFQLLSENVERLKIPGIKLETWENSLKEKYENIWVDAPCTSSGLLRRFPEMKVNRSWQDIGSTLLVQKKLLEVAIDRLKPGGHLIYSVCSVLSAECNSSKIVLNHPGLKVLANFVHWPHESPFGDGFQAVLFLKST